MAPPIRIGRVPPWPHRQYHLRNLKEPVLLSTVLNAAFPAASHPRRADRERISAWELRIGAQWLGFAPLVAGPVSVSAAVTAVAIMATGALARCAPGGEVWVRLTVRGKLARGRMACKMAVGEPAFDVGLTRERSKGPLDEGLRARNTPWHEGRRCWFCLGEA
jgi:hypothetical protein